MRNPKDHGLILEQLFDRCKCFIEHILQASDVHNVCGASLALFVQRRQEAREMLQAKITLEAQPHRNQHVAPCCPDARPEVGNCTDDVRGLDASVPAALPHWVANDLSLRDKGVALSSGGQQGLLTSTADAPFLGDRYPASVWRAEVRFFLK